MFLSYSFCVKVFRLFITKSPDFLLQSHQIFLTKRFIFKIILYMEYKRKISDKKLSEKLDIMGAVLIEGPKLTGKQHPYCSLPLLQYS